MKMAKQDYPWEKGPPGAFLMTHFKDVIHAMIAE